MARWMLLAVPLALSCGGSGDFGRVGSGGTGSDGGTAADGGIPADAGVSGIVAISLSQTDVHIPVGTMTAFAVTGIRSDGTRVDVTPEAEAQSANPNIAAVAKGPGSQIQIFGVAAGTTTVKVEFGSLEQTAAVTITPR
jgi:hypothetical protein